MKKFRGAIILMVALALLASACGGGDDTAEADAAAAQAAAEAAAAAAQAAEAEAQAAEAQAQADAAAAEAAAALTRAAYRRALRLRTDEALPVIGLACTAALATDRPKKGDHRAHIGLADAEGIRVWSLTLHKGARDRSGEEQVVTALLLSLLAEACGLEARQQVGLLAQERLIVAEFPSTSAL